MSGGGWVRTARKGPPGPERSPRETRDIDGLGPLGGLDVGHDIVKRTDALVARDIGEGAGHIKTECRGLWVR